MTSPTDSSLNQQFQQAADRVANLEPSEAGASMNTLYGLYKQATDGDHDTFQGEVGREDHDNPNGPAGLSQAQWDSWSQFKGMSQEDAMRQYVAEAGKLGSAGSHGKGDGPDEKKAPANPDEHTGSDEPNFSQAQPTGETPTHTPAAATGPTGTEADAVGAGAGLQGDLRAGAPYGSEEELKENPDAQQEDAAPNHGITES